ncbi:MAG: flavodoxin-dependent (E)-4-hydroxy-3-methylbut-2-enyl-diphosphate synthase [Thermodesulfobacteriota bacterium]|nr:flavodoxin-dependent (E)-4-hydroxy-3-methylbut-2-enyl-diphosphate synthase [Thermodesulfobacteriota bacterium]
MKDKSGHTRRIILGKVAVGGGAPVSIQSMTNTLTTDVTSTLYQIHALEAAGCDIVRVSIPDMESLEALPAIKKDTKIPLVADIHFDYRLAVGSIEAGADGVRINPGNIGSRQKVGEVARAAIEHDIPIRVGVNLGSIRRGILERFPGDHVSALVESAREHVEMLEDMGVEAIKVSLKSSDVLETIEINRRFAAISDRPLHIGVTEAGTLFSGLIRSSVGIGTLLLEGIGDTIRISLSDDPVKEVYAGQCLLESLNIRKQGVRVIACPTCARAQIDVPKIAAEIEEALAGEKIHLKVAVMGCIVNGPGEARDADIGIAGISDGSQLFVHGKFTRRIKTEEVVSTVLDEVRRETGR